MSIAQRNGFQFLADGGYRIATVKSADQVSLEAGNSPSVIFKNYREMATEDQANEWFGILPKVGQWENA